MNDAVVIANGNCILHSCDGIFRHRYLTPVYISATDNYVTGMGYISEPSYNNAMVTVVHRHDRVNFDTSFCH